MRLGLLRRMVVVRAGSDYNPLESVMELIFEFLLSFLGKKVLWMIAGAALIVALFLLWK